MAEKTIFTENDMRIMANAMLCLKSSAPEIDYQKLAEKLSMQNPRSASNAWAIVKKKIAAADENGATVAVSTPKKGSKKANAVKEGEEGNGGDGECEAKSTPVKKSGGKKRAAKIDGEDGSPRKKGRKGKEEAKEDPVDSGVEDAAAVKQEDADEAEAMNAEEVA